MKKIVLFIVFTVFTIALSLNGFSQVVVIPLDDDFFVIPIGACEERVIPTSAQVVDAGDARVIVATDMAGIGGVTASDPDDIQSLVHLLTFSDKVDIEGLTTSPPRASSVSNNAQSRARILDIINAFNSDRANLISSYGSDFPTKASLDAVVKDGSIEYHNIDTTPSYTNEAVQHIIERARCGWFSGDKRPLYLLGWGSANDFAQAIFNAPDIKKVVRLVTYSRTNNGRFTSGSTATNNGLTCSLHSSVVPNYLQSCKAWDYLRANTDLWWVDYTGGTRPMNLCDTATITDILGGGSLGGKIIDNYVAPHFEQCNNAYGGTLTTNKWLKMGDSWTLLFVFNTAAQRNNPSAAVTYGQYYKPNAAKDYWQLYSDEFKGRATAQSEWRARANNL